MSTPISPVTTPAHISRNITLEFTPADENAFQRAAIKGGRVLLTPVLENGQQLEPSQWRISRLRPESNLRGNILSRKEFRRGTLDERVLKIQATLLP